MTDKKNKNKKKCAKKGKGMLAYGVTQLSSSVVSALALTSIALSLGTVKEQSKVFNKCVEEVKANSSNSTSAVRFCNGGN